MYTHHHALCTSTCCHPKGPANSEEFSGRSSIQYTDSGHLAGASNVSSQKLADPERQCLSQCRQNKGQTFGRSLPRGLLHDNRPTMSLRHPRRPLDHQQSPRDSPPSPSTSPTRLGEDLESRSNRIGRHHCTSAERTKQTAAKPRHRCFDFVGRAGDLVMKGKSNGSCGAVCSECHEQAPSAT